MYLLFRNSKNGRIENNMYHSTDAPLYVEPITTGPNKGFYIDVVREVVISVDNNIIKYASLVNDEFRVIGYYDENCNLIEPSKPLYYSEMINH